MFASILQNNLYKFFNEKKDIEFVYDSLYDEELTRKLEEINIEYDKCFDKFKFRDAQNLMCTVAEYGNKFLQDNKPWDVCKTDKDHGKCIMSYANYIVCVLIKLMKPFMPRKSDDLSKNFVLLFVGGENKIIVNNERYTIPFKIIDIPKEYQIGYI